MPMTRARTEGRSAFSEPRASSSTASSVTSSPLSDTSAPQRSWVSLLVPKVDERNVDTQNELVEQMNPRFKPFLGDRTGAYLSRKRSVEAEETQATESERATQPKRKYPKRKHRKGIHALRKEEKERLLEEMEMLQREMEALKKKALDPNFQVGQLVRKSQRQILREKLQGHQETFCKALSIMSDYTLCNVQAGAPLQEKIFLKKDLASRYQTLRAMKAGKLKKAENFLRVRRSNLDPCKSLTEDRRYETESGNFTSAHFSITQFEGVRSAKQIFDLVIYYFNNMEISVSEKLDNIVTIRENDDDSTIEGITQNCLVSTTTKTGKKMESKTIMFSNYCERDDMPSADRGYGIVASEFVDDDECYPYHPNERVRKDVSGVIEVRAFHRQDHSAANADEDIVVVMTRWVQNTLHRPAFPMEPEGWRELRHSMDSWGLSLHRTLLESLHPEP